MHEAVIAKWQEKKKRVEGNGKKLGLVVAFMGSPNPHYFIVEEILGDCILGFRSREEFKAPETGITFVNMMNADTYHFAAVS